MSKAISPPFRWIGGKRRLTAKYWPYLPKEIGHYYEPFFGGGAMFFKLMSEGRIKSATISDSETPLINAMKWIKDDVEALIAELQSEFSGYTHTREEYESRRDEFNYMLPSNGRLGLRAASHFIFLTRTCFNGVMRYNRSNFMNMNRGDIKFDDPLDLVRGDELKAVSGALKRVIILNDDFSEVVPMAKPGDLLYVDPPYHPLPGKKSFVGYNQEPFGVAEQGALAALCTVAAHQGVSVMASNSGTELIKSLYNSSTFELLDMMANRSVNSKGGDRGPVREYLIVSKGYKKVGS